MISLTDATYKSDQAISKSEWTKKHTSSFISEKYLQQTKQQTKSDKKYMYMKPSIFK